MSETDATREVEDKPAKAETEIAKLDDDDGPAGLEDVKQLGLFAAISSLGYVFWIVGGMEMVERLAYYGVKAVAAIYAKDPVSKGGLGITPLEYGQITGIWAAVQSFVPVFTGALSDRYGYKQTIFVSTIVKILGYITMATFASYWGFMAGAIVLALGTAIFKPGIQGTLVNSTKRENSSMAWGIFYQTVNIGGWMGPLVASFLRSRFGWREVFLACVGIICLNFLLLLTYKEPKKEERLARDKAILEGKVERVSLVRDSLMELRKPHVWVYLLIFSGFWFMFNALFDVLPLHIAEWVNTKNIVSDLFGPGGTKSTFFQFFLGMNEAGTEVNPEGMLNLNAGLIMFTCFFFAWISGKMRATTSMVVGTLMATGAMFMSGYSTLGWLSVAAILTFSIGEMLSSPKFSEFIGNFAPSNKKAMYLGFSQIPLGIGWTLEGFTAPALYGHFASKERFSRELLAQKGMPQAEIDAIKGGEAFDVLVKFAQSTPEEMTRILYESHSVGTVWTIMGAVGIMSAIFIYMYGRWVAKLVLAKKK
ncbi:MAG TPA: MFS transporter [Polyangiaceae bacterium]|nr:MFS transporter [Polyangiaceae bacterium]